MATSSWGAAGAVMRRVVVIWGLGPPLTKLIPAPPLVGVSVRFWIAIPLVWIVTYTMGSRVTMEVAAAHGAAGVLFGINLTFVFSALHHASVAVLSVIQTLQPASC